MSNPLSLNTLPPQTRAALSSQSSSNVNPVSSSPSSPTSILSNGHGHGQGAGQQSHSHAYSERDNESLLSAGKTPRPGTSLINMNATSQNLSMSTTVGPNSLSGGNNRTMRGGNGNGSGTGGDHLGGHEHHTYSHQADEYDDLGTPTSGKYHTASHYGHGSPRSPPTQLRSRPFNANLVDPYSPANPNSGLHALHSKGSNLSTNTFMPRNKDRNTERDDGVPKDETIQSPLTPTPGGATPTPGGMAPSTLYPSTPTTGSATQIPSAGVASANSKPPRTEPAPKVDNRPTSAVPVHSTAPNGPRENVSKPKTGTATATASNSRVSGSAANGAPRERDRERERRTRDRDREDGHSSRKIKVRTIPHLPHGPAEPAPSTLMYWSRAPVYGHLPSRAFRAHSVTLVDNTAWLFGGCDERGCARDVWCCDVETFQWTHPSLTGDIPPPCRAHTATLVDGKRIFIFGGGEGPTYYNTLYILDTQARRFTWVPCGQKPPGTTANTTAEAGSTGPSVSSTPQSANPPLLSSSSRESSASQNGGASSNPPPPMPLPRRAHTTVLYRNKLYIFGGGNGVKALNDVWSLDTSATVEKMRWETVKTSSPRPGPRGYHTANLVGNNMIVVGGSDGRECFSDIWVLNLDTLVWTLVDTDKEYKRLSHSSTQVGSYLFIMGGHDGMKYSSELLLFNLVTLQYEHKITLGRPPPARGYHISLLADARLLVFGGFDGHSVYDDVWLLDLAGAAYLPQVTSFALLIDGGN